MTIHLLSGKNRGLNETVTYYFKVQNLPQISHDDFHDMFIYSF